MDPPAKGSLNAGYHSLYYGEGESKFIKAIEIVRDALWLHRTQLVQRAANARTGTVLDIGCGNGRFLESMIRIGWTAYGTELPGPAFDRASRIAGLHLYPASDGPLPLPNGSVDAVTMWHVLEHMPDPAGVLSECHRVLRPGGVLIVEVPNVGSWQARWTGRHWLHLDPPRHIFQFTRPSLKQMLERASFEIRACSTLSLEMGAMGVAQSVMNAVLPTRDVFYKTLQRGAGVPHRHWEQGLSFLLFFALIPVIAGLPFIEAMAGAGSVLRLTCLRER